jgi:hypothetical protein
VAAAAAGKQPPATAAAAVEEEEQPEEEEEEEAIQVREALWRQVRDPLVMLVFCGAALKSTARWARTKEFNRLRAPICAESF